MKNWALQQAIETRLKAHSAVTALVSSRVYDHAPQGTAFPYIEIGEDTTIPFETDTSVGGEHSLVLHIWSRYRGKKEVKQIQDAIYAALNRYDLPVSGAHTVLCEHETSDSEIDPDGLTRHGTMTFRVILED